MCEHAEGIQPVALRTWEKKANSAKFEESWILNSVPSDLSASSLFNQKKKNIIAKKWDQSCTGQF